MKKTILTLTVMLMISLLLLGEKTSYAAVKGVCGNCHTMHNSEAGLPEDPDGTNDYLLVDSCVGCHSSGSSPTYTLGTSTIVPVVNFTGGGEPPNILAGGNFYWVADLGGNDDAKGHNVLGISGPDVITLAGLGAPGNLQTADDCQSGGCHGTLAVINTSLFDKGLRAGCQGCHLNVRHHANDGTGSKYVDNADQGWYRFLAGHAGDTVLNYGVKGIEDEDWQATVTDADHNEYLGVPVDKTGVTTLSNGSMSAFCCGCHGNFHVQNETAATGSGSQSPWIRHPSDFIIPSTGEYAGMSVDYSSRSPVARPTGFAGWATDTPSSAVAPGTDLVMCLSCHRPHGSANDDLLRWDYSMMVAGGGGGLDNQGCFYCHVTKDD